MIDDDLPDLVYYNCDIINNRTTSAGIDPEVRFNETRDAPIIRDSSQYYFSIVRFTMNGPNKELPIFIPSIQTNQSNINLTNYSLRIKGVIDDPTNPDNKPIQVDSGEVFVLFEPENQNERLPSTPNTIQDIQSTYYFVYTYQHFLNLINKTFQTAIQNIKDKYKSTLQTTAPKMIYNGNSVKTFSIFCDDYGFGGDDRREDSTEQLDIYFNRNMYGLFAGFHFYNVGSISESEGINYKLIVQELGVKGDNNRIENNDSPDYLKMTQDYESTSSLWCPIDSIVFSTTVIPIIYEQIGEPAYTDNATNVGQLTGSKSAFQPIITDISLPLQSASDYRGMLYYAPEAEYRMSSFTKAKHAIHNIDIQVFFKNRLTGELFPITMFNLSSISVKMLFRKKNYVR